MRLRYLLIIGLSSIVMVGCAREVSNNQANESPIAVNASIPVPSIQKKPLANSGQAPKTNTINSGTFVSGEQTTNGKVSITIKDGKSFLEIDDSFKTSESGPDLVVILHRSDNVINSTKPPSYSLKKGDYIILAPLQKYSGAQTYSIPQNINLADYKSVGIWCRKFNATFGTASLSQ
ncbi:MULTISPECIES: DM13 domain-containing protein [unclassified Nostoc]|uniref:DM13 domain-containing protein n=1 Tax=unclassified Nostoc TaxID=2593658 RepID=UPI0013D5A272|nr:MULTISPECIES: DM13 domain-containing protein [unclassified Nostoc]MBE8991922.1 DM13 domain-containing protein [Nostoc sp. LEGE 12450]NEU82399.1 DM13 domain-containing protein [Nostoc sp. UIC 10630]